MKIGEALKYLGGGAVVYVVMAACAGSPRSNTVEHDAAMGAGGTEGADSEVVDGLIDQLTDPVPEAHAEPTPTCQQWEVDTVEGYAVIPAGWEPFAVTEGYDPDNKWYRHIYVRQCTQ